MYYSLCVEAFSTPQLYSEVKLRDLNVKDLLSGVKVGGKNPFRTLEEDLWSSIPFWIPTGAVSLDYAIAGYKKGAKGGIPAGRFVELFGEESSGKSTLLDHIIKNALSMGFLCVLGDREHAHDHRRLKEIGIDPTNLVFIERPRDAEEPVHTRGRKSKDVDYSADFTLEDFFEVGEAIFKAIRQQNEQIPVLMALDSIAVTPTRLQANLGLNEDMNMKERLDKSIVLSDRFPDFCSLITKNNGVLIFVNQLRSRPGIAFGDPDYAPGGNTTKFLASLRIKLEGGDIIKASEDPFNAGVFSGPDDPIGMRVKFNIVKNKVAPPLRKGTFPIFFDERGIFDPLCFLELLEDRKIFDMDIGLEKNGSWYSYKEERIGQGRNQVAQLFYENPDIQNEIEKAAFDVMDKADIVLQESTQNKDKKKK